MNNPPLAKPISYQGKIIFVIIIIENRVWEGGFGLGDLIFGLKIGRISGFGKLRLGMEIGDHDCNWGLRIVI